LEELASMQSDFIFSNKVTLQEINTKLSNDNGLELEYEDRGIFFEIVFKEKASTNIMDGFFEFRERKYDRKQIIEEANLILNAYKNKVELPKTGKCPVIFPVNNAPNTKFITDLNGQLFAVGGSLFSDKLGKKAFSEDFTLYQSFNPEDNVNVPFFDAEGVVNKDYRYAFIEDGIINSPYTDKKTASKNNLEVTGSSAAVYDGVPVPQCYNFKIKESEKTLKELLKGEMGILIMVASGGDFTSNGDFGTPVQLGMLFDGEKLVGRLPEFQISSNIFEMYGSSFRGAGKDTVLPYSSTKFVVMDLNVSNI
jgi:PmbA protein